MRVCVSVVVGMPLCLPLCCGGIVSVVFIDVVSGGVVVVARGVVAC